LHLPRTRKTVVDQPAILIRLLVKFLNCGHAKVREVVAEFFEVLLTENLFLFVDLNIRLTPRRQALSIFFSMDSNTCPLAS
jgi:hypothetical protein